MNRPAVEEAGARQEGHRLATGIYEIPVDLALIGGGGPVAQDAVLRLKDGLMPDSARTVLAGMVSHNHLSVVQDTLGRAAPRCNGTSSLGGGSTCRGTRSDATSGGSNLPLSTRLHQLFL
jgi:hypothetical protein